MLNFARLIDKRSTLIKAIRWILYSRNCGNCWFVDVNMLSLYAYFLPNQVDFSFGDNYNFEKIYKNNPNYWSLLKLIPTMIYYGIIPT